MSSLDPMEICTSQTTLATTFIALMEQPVHSWTCSYHPARADWTRHVAWFLDLTATETETKTYISPALKPTTFCGSTVLLARLSMLLYLREAAGLMIRPRLFSAP